MSFSFKHVAHQIDGETSRTECKYNYHPNLGVRSNIIKFRLHCQILRFLYQTLCAFLQIKDRKHIEKNFHSVARIMPHWWDLGVLGGSQNFSVGICNGAHLTAHSSFFIIYMHYLLRIKHI